MTIRISLICALTPDRVIGKNNQLPWQMPADLQYFRQMTLHKPVIMGRKTFESIGKKPLSERKNIVITRNKNYQKSEEFSNFSSGFSEVKFFEDLTSGITFAKDYLALNSDLAQEIFIIGGAGVFDEALKLDLIDYLYLTFIKGNIQGDVFFPAWHKDRYQEISRQDFKADQKNPYPYSFVVFKKI